MKKGSGAKGRGYANEGTQRKWRKGGGAMQTKGMGGMRPRKGAELCKGGGVSKEWGGAKGAGLCKGGGSQRNGVVQRGRGYAKEGRLKGMGQCKGGGAKQMSQGFTNELG